MIITFYWLLKLLIYFSLLMVLIGTQINVSDNSGAIKVNCIKILGSSKCNHSNLGDTLVVSVRQAKKDKKVKLHDVCNAILIRQAYKTYRQNGSYIFSDKNSVVLVKKNKTNDPIGNRVIGGVTSELRYKKCMKIILMASNII